MTNISTPISVGPKWQFRRELGIRPPLGSRDLMAKQCYKSMIYDHLYSNLNYGGVFCLEYSPSGSILTAACEKRSILLFDQFNLLRINTIEDAHNECVNCIKFIDSNTFASCSDDYTVALWDLRKTNKKLHELRGHSNWVKSIEYSAEDNLLVTSGFDGNLLIWDLSEHSEISNTKVFSMNGLMRSRISADNRKMVISTTAGYLLVVHNLDLNHLKTDLENFRPNMYRLMQLSQTLLPVTSDFSHLFRGPGKRNRVEIICDFPDSNDAEVIASVQIHPEGHCVLSRNTSHNESSEWTCVHSIEENLGFESDDEYEEPINWSRYINKSTLPTRVIPWRPTNEDPYREEQEQILGQIDASELTFSPADVWEAVVAIQDARLRREQDRAVPRMNPFFTSALSSRRVASAADAPASSSSSDSRVPPRSRSNGTRRNLERPRDDPGEGSSQQNSGQAPSPIPIRSCARALRRMMRDRRSRGSGRSGPSVRLRTRYEPNETARLQASSAETSDDNVSAVPRSRASSGSTEVMLGVFRRGGAEGGRGTSIRRHNIATLTIASSDGETEDAEEPSVEPTQSPISPIKSSLSPPSRASINKKIHQNIRRLTHFIQEANIGQGFIKEPCFSPDGRIICSPHRQGIRLLAFNPYMLQPWQCFPARPPIELHVALKHDVGLVEKDVVVSSKFSSHGQQLAAGCLSGKIVVFKPTY